MAQPPAAGPRRRRVNSEDALAHAPASPAPGEPPAWARYGAALVLTAASAGLYALLEPILAPRVFLLFMPAVVLSAWYGGMGPALLASVLTIALADVFFSAPVGVLALDLRADAIELAVFFVVALSVSSIVESLRRSRREAEEARERAHFVSEVGATLGGSPQYEQAFGELANLLVRHMADYAVAYEVDAPGSVRRVAVAHADPELEPLVHELLDLRPPTDARSGAGLAIASGEPIIASEITDAMLEAAATDDEHRRILFELRPVSSIVVPLRTRGHTVGAIALATTPRSNRRYGPEDLALVQEIADRAALVLDNARLLRDAVRSEKRLRRLADAGGLLASSLDYEDTLEHVARLAVEALGEVCTVDLLVDGAVRRVAVAHRDPSRHEIAERLKRWPPDPSREIGVARALRTGECHVDNDVDPSWLESRSVDTELVNFLRELDLSCFVVAPMIARDTPLGAITVASTRASARRYGEDDVRFAREVAERAALAIDNARLFREARSAVKLREEVLAVVSHDLRNLLGTLLASTHLLLESDPPPAKRRELLGRELRVLGEAERLIAGLLDVSRAEAGHLELERVLSSPGGLLRRAVAAFQESAAGEGIELHSRIDDNLPRVLVDPDRTLRVLYNLLSNAIKYSKPGGFVEVAAERTEEGDMVVFRVSDDGPGIPLDERTRIFEPFWRSGGSGRDGTGLGLAIAKSLVEAHGGRIRLESEAGPGSTFYVEIPAARDEAGADGANVGEAGGSAAAG